MPEIPNDKPDPEKDNSDVDLLRRLPVAPISPFRRPVKPEPKEEEPIEEFWAVFSMMTQTGERFSINVCFRNRQHYNSQMSKFETAKNIHIVLHDINDESVVIKRDILLHVLPVTIEEISDKKRW